MAQGTCQGYQIDASQELRSQNWAGLVGEVYQTWKHRYAGRRAFGYLCTYAPLELLHAAGLTPVRLMPLGAAVALVGAHLPSFSCAPARAVTERRLQGELGFLDGVLFAHACDTMQCVADIWRMSGDGPLVLTFSVPTVLNGPHAKMYLLAELQQMAKALEARFGAPITEDALRESIAVYNEQRRLLSELYEQRRRFSTEEVWALTLLGMLIPVEEHCALLRSSLSQKLDQPRTDEHGAALLLVGAVFDDPSLLGLITELGGRVVGDDLCTGSRYFDTPVDEGAEPYSALAERYLLRAPCPAKHAGIGVRVERVLSLVRATRSDGVIFLSPKFCEPHAFDYVALGDELDKIGIAHLLLESEVTAPEGQMRTRLQAFLEMLEQTSR